MNEPVWKLIKIAKSISAHDPLLSYELERGARSLSATMNPEAMGLEKDIESTLTVLKSMRQEISLALAKLETDSDTEEFAKFFDDAADAEVEELKRLMKGRTSSRVAGPKEWLRKLFKGGPEGVEKHDPSKDEVSDAKYNMSDSDMDSFVDGGDWKDPGHYVGEEAKENNEFFSGVKNLLGQFEKIRKEPSKRGMLELMKALDTSVKGGQKILDGTRKHQQAPEGEEDAMDTLNELHRTRGEGKGEDDGVVDLSKHFKKDDFTSKAVGFAEQIRDAKGDEGKLKSIVKEMFDKLGPELSHAKAASVGSLVRMAHANPAIRPGLLLIIKKTLAA